ncbi:endoplasmic reticulum Oxidoreductin 1-domain-containing protein [Limtongia smithiae]|uniref:endoplasmic reticulum Oxidoreductin 1-domain-containing protein n=1 Tax=Limtongia smithiae TaxID=1125753 RepID=UPI0034CEECC2
MRLQLLLGLPSLALLACLLTPSLAYEEISESSYYISAIDTANKERLRPLLHDIVTTSDFFRYYRLDLFGRPCLFWSDEGMCGNRACAVDTIDDESHLPEIWRSEYLGRLSSGSTIEFDDDFDDGFGDDVEESCVKDTDAGGMSMLGLPKDYCVPEDESADGPGVYVSLLDNPERYTGYMGPHANMIWNAIYTENCFPDATSPSISVTGGPLATPPSSCVEKRVFYKLVSGMHASVSTHLCNEYLDTETGEWGPNLEMFMARVGNYPDRIANIYFNYGLVAKAVAKLRHYLEDFTFCTNAQGYDAETRRKMLRIAVEADRSLPVVFDAKKLFLGNPQLKEEFRTKFVNVSRIMDCTGCDKCRLWGKLQVTGYATALKILFDLPEDGTGSEVQLRRMEMVALINTFDRLSKSVDAIDMFNNMLSGSPESEPEISEQANEKKDSENTSQISAWDEEWSAAWEGIKFIMKSYYYFPRNMWRIFLYHANKVWIRFVGREEYVAAQQQQKYDRFLHLQPTPRDEL